MIYKKRKVLVNLDGEVYVKAKEFHISISSFCNDTLKSYIEKLEDVK